MLVLTRKSSEQIRIGDEIVVTVLRTSAGRVKIGIDAPNDVAIVRGECLFDEAAAVPAPTVPTSTERTAERPSQRIREMMTA